jgi:hypothetical protein
MHCEQQHFPSNVTQTYSEIYQYLHDTDSLIRLLNDIPKKCDISIFTKRKKSLKTSTGIHFDPSDHKQHPKYTTG